MKDTRKILAGDAYNSLIKTTDEDGEICFTVEGHDSRGAIYHFSFDNEANARKLYDVLNP
jgi:hypothetical protein